MSALAIAGPALLLLPGLALLVLWPPADGWGLGRRLLAAPGASVAAIALAYQFAWAAGLGLNAALVGLAVAAAGAVALAGALWAARAARRETADALPAALLAAIFGLTLASRLQAVAGLDVPLWWDSVHHTTIVQLMLENGGIFSSWEPYAPLSTFNYHFGFHAVASGLAWLGGLAAPAAVLLLGQLLNACTVPVGYLLAERLTGKAWAGVAAALVTGLVSLTPAYYVNWGRYTQLAGQVILPVAIVLTMEAVERGGWRRVAVAAALAAGLTLTHYRVAIFYAAFVLAFALVRAYQQRRAPAALGREAARLAALAALALALAGPWAWHLLQEMVPRYLDRWSAPVAPAVAEWLASYNSLRDLDALLPPYLLWTAAAALLLGMLCRQRAAFLLLLWVEGLFLAANPGWLGLPGTGDVSNHAVLIGLYVPLSCAIGMGAALLLEQARRFGRLGAAARWAVAAGVLAVAVWGWHETGRVVDPFFQLVTPADQKAMAWIRENTPADALFLANSARAYGDSTVVGTDAGWWIPLLTGRAGTVPVMIYATERSEPPGYALRTNDLEETVRTRSPASADGLEALGQAGVTHVYIGARGGYLKAEDLAASPAFEQVYAQDSVWVFAIREPR